MVLDTLTTREAVRRAALDDIIARAELAAVTLEADMPPSLDGIKVISIGKLRDQVSGALMVKLPPSPDTHAEVTTPATITTSAICPECDYPVTLTVKLNTQLTVDDDGAEISVKAKVGKVPHQHGQLSLDGAATEVDQVTMEDLDLDDHRLRILRAVAVVGDRYTDAAPDAEPPPAPTLDAIAIELELATEADRFDLLDSLAGYEQADPPLVTILVEGDTPAIYALTDAGSELIDAAEPEEGDDQGEAT